MIEAIELTSTRRSRGTGSGPVQGVSFDVYPGQVTALLGAPGAGKSTVLRLMVELEPGGGRTLFGGRPYRALRPAVREVGLALNPDAVHPGRTVQAHLQLYAAGGGVPKPRVAEVLEVAGLSTQATVRCGRLDPGQRQRLAIAAALIGDPAALILDEPHALDTHGMSWFHALIRAYAAQGRTVLVAATDPDTLSGTADHVVVLRRDEQDGISRVIASRSAAEVFDEHRATVVQVRSPQAARLAAALEAEGARLAPAGPGALQVRGLDRARIGEVAHVAGVCLHELCEIGHDDDVFGLRPVPRQKELLPGLTRTDATWHSGVRLVPDEIEEAEVIEAAAEAGIEAGTEAGTEAADREGALAEVVATAPAVSVGAQAPAERQAGQVAGGAEQHAGHVGAQVPAERQVGQVAGAEQYAGHVGSSNVGAQVPAERQAGPVAGAAEQYAGHVGGADVGAQVPVEWQAGHVGGASVGAQAPAERQTGHLASAADAQGSVAVPRESAAGMQSGGAADAATSPAPVAGPESVASASVEAPAGQQAGAAIDARESASAGLADGPKPSAPGSWRTQGSVAGSRWSAVKGSQARQGSVARVQPSTSATVPSESAATANGAATEAPQDTANSAVQQKTATNQQATVTEPTAPAAAPAALPSPEPRTPAKSPEAQRPNPRRGSAFGLRWGRGRSQRAAARSQPELVAAAVAVAPAAAASAPAQAPAAAASAPAAVPVTASAPAPVTATASAPAPAAPAPPPAAQPAVPFTVASPAADAASDRDGMTPWRAVAARATHQAQSQAQTQNQHQVSAAESAPAEQEKSS